MINNNKEYIVYCHIKEFIQMQHSKFIIRLSMNLAIKDFGAMMVKVDGLKLV